MRGVLPQGPNGVGAFNTLSSSPISDPHALAGISSYRYSLDLQGLSSGVKCEYTPSSPVVFNLTFEGVFQNLGSCPSGQDVLPERTLLFSVISRHTLGSWICGQGSRNPDGSFGTYLLHLRGYRDYDRNIGNITCTISPVQPAIYPVTFSTKAGVFTSAEPRLLFPSSPSDLVRQSIMAISSIVTESQGLAANIVAESVITSGVKSFGLPPYAQDPQYLRLFEAMLQGMLEYQVSVESWLRVFSGPGLILSRRT